MKIAHLTTVDISLKILLLNQMKSIQADGHEVIALSSPGPSVPEIKAAGIRHIPVEMTRRITPIRDLISLINLIQIFRRERLDILHTHNPKPGLLGPLAAFLAGVPFVVHTVHGYHFHEQMHPLASWILKQLEKISSFCCNAILFQNREDMELAIREKIVPSEKATFLGNGIDLSLFAPERVTPNEQAASAASLGVLGTNDVPIVGFVGRLAGTRKGVLNLLAAMKKVSAKIPQVKLLLVGSPDKGKADEVGPALAQQMGIEKICIFAGWRSQAEMPTIYSFLDLLVLPSTFEGLPRAIMEASSMKVPIVATDVKGNREAVVNGETGLLIPFGDVDALAEAILKVLESEPLRHKFGNSGYEHALRSFDEKMVFGRVKSTYSKLWDKKVVRTQAVL